MKLSEFIEQQEQLTADLPGSVTASIRKRLAALDNGEDGMWKALAKLTHISERPKKGVDVTEHIQRFTQAVAHALLEKKSKRVTIDGLSWAERIAWCESPEDFVQLFEVLGITNGTWKNSSIVQNQYSGLAQVIIKKFGNWPNFLEHMGESVEISWAQKVRDCQSPNDFIVLFESVGVTGNDWHQAEFLKKKGLHGIVIGIRGRFGDWDSFLKFMKVTREKSLNEKISDCITADDFLRLIRSFGILSDEWQNAKWLQSNGHTAFQLGIRRKFKGWRNFLIFMDVKTVTGKMNRKPWKKEVEACHAKEEVITLMRESGIDGDQWHNSPWLQKNGYYGLYEALRDYYGTWYKFLEFMGVETKIPWTERVRACEEPADLLMLFKEIGCSDDNWQNSRWFDLNGYSGLLKALTDRFKTWGAFLEFMGLEVQAKWTERVNSCVTKENFLSLFETMGATVEQATNTSWLQENDYKGFIHAIYHRFGNWPKFLEFLQIREQAEDKEFSALAQLKLEEAVALLQDDAFKLKLFLQFAHPEMTEGDMNRLVIRSFKGLVTGLNETKENQYLGWRKELNDVDLQEELPEETTDTTVTISGSTKDADCVYISGTWNRRVRVESDGTFSVVVPLKIGQENEIRVMALNRDREVRSSQQEFLIDQQGDSDDVAALIELLSQLQTDLLEGIRKNPGRMQFFVSCAEKVLIKKFGRSFEDGKLYMQELISSTKSPVVKKVLSGVLKNFRDINCMKLPNVREGSLMFFQKYCVYAIRKKMAEGASGVVLANDPGLGKTRTILAALAEDEAAIFSPNSVVSAWDEEASECLMEPDLLVMRDIPHETRKELLRDRKYLRLVTNVQFLRKTSDAERFVLLSNGGSVVVHDEAHSRANEHSEQSKGAKMLHHRFQINVSATPFKNPKTLRRILHLLEPDDARFSSDTAFEEAFPARDPEALKTLSLLKDKYTIRFRKQDVMEEVDPALHLSQQLHRLPRKEYVPPETIGQFEMSEDQAEAIYELFLNWSDWCRRYDKYMPDDEVAEEDHLRSGGNLTKRHALRQTVNNPEYVGSNAEDAKAWQMQRIVKKCLKEGRKVVIFCAYNAQTMKYAEIFKQYNPALYTGLTSNEGEKKNEEGEPMRFAREQIGKGKKRGWLFDPNGYPIEDSRGETMPVLDYERLSFQHADDRKLIIATYQTGAVGTTFTAGKAMILDDLPADCIEAIQAEDRIHRIDPHHQTQATVKYYTMQSRYPQRFLDKMKKRWVRKLDDGTYEEVRSKLEAEAEDLQTAYDAFFAQGTLDQVHGQNLVTQKQMFHLINDGIADESILREDQILSSELQNGNRLLKNS